MEVCGELYPYAGLLVCIDAVTSFYYGQGQKHRNLFVVRAAKRLHRIKATEQAIMRLAYGARNTAIHYGEQSLKAVVR